MFMVRRRRLSAELTARAITAERLLLGHQTAVVALGPNSHPESVKYAVSRFAMRHEDRRRKHLLSVGRVDDGDPHFLANVANLAAQNAIAKESCRHGIERIRLQDIADRELVDVKVRRAIVGK
jgi:hypothetical protein